LQLVLSFISSHNQILVLTISTVSLPSKVYFFFLLIKRRNFTASKNKGGLF